MSSSSEVCETVMLLSAASIFFTLVFFSGEEQIDSGCSEPPVASAVWDRYRAERSLTDEEASIRFLPWTDDSLVSMVFLSLNEVDSSPIVDLLRPHSPVCSYLISGWTLSRLWPGGQLIFIQWKWPWLFLGGGCCCVLH